MRAFRLRELFSFVFAGLTLAGGCLAISDRLSGWDMFGPDALNYPLRAVGGDAIVFSPNSNEQAWDCRRLAIASPQELVAYYAPVFLQQRVNTRARAYPYPPEFDEIGEAQLRREEGGKLKAFVAGAPKVYAHYEKRQIDGHEHIQLTYTAWYPAHPRMKAVDLEAADLDSCVVRVTLGKDRAPLFFETIGAGGCFHKIFVERWLEQDAMKTFKEPAKDKKYAVERKAENLIDWEVAGVVDEPHSAPRRPVVFVKAGDHRVMGLGSTARLHLPAKITERRYTLAEYTDLYAIAVAGSTERAPFFEMGKGNKLWLAEPKDRMTIAQVGLITESQPPAKDQLKLHFDQTTWSDPTIYARCLRFPAGTL